MSKTFVDDAATKIIEVKMCQLAAICAQYTLPPTRFSVTNPPARLQTLISAGTFFGRIKGSGDCIYKSSTILGSELAGHCSQPYEQTGQATGEAGNTALFGPLDEYLGLYSEIF